MKTNVIPMFTDSTYRSFLCTKKHQEIKPAWASELPPVPTTGVAVAADAANTACNESPKVLEDIGNTVIQPTFKERHEEYQKCGKILAKTFGCTRIKQMGLALPRYNLRMLDSTNHQ